MSQQVRSKPNKKAQEKVLSKESSVSDKTDLVNQLDDILDEIDEVLEDNAEEFMRNYIQKGGQ